MNFVFISPHFPTNFQNFVIRLNQKGIRVLGIADMPYNDLSNELKENLTEYYKVDNLENYDEVLRACGYFTHKYGKIDRIESLNEHWLELDAALRTDFNVFGFTNEDMEHIKRKSGMKEVFRAAGVPVAPGRVFHGYEDALELVEELGYPVCIKPDIGVGAGDTYKIKSRDDLDRFFSRDYHNDFIMEAFVNGEIVTYDGLTDKDGNTVFNSTLSYNCAVLDIVSFDTDMYYYIPREIPEEIVEVGERIVKAFGLKERFFHIELFRENETGEIIALEINCRVPGGKTTDMFNYANDIDIYSLYADIVLENRFDAEITRPYYCCYASRKSKRDYVYSNDEIMGMYPEEFISIEAIPGVFSAVMGDFGFIFRTVEEERLYQIIRDISAQKG